VFVSRASVVMPDEVFIYAIVALNALLQVLLIGRLGLPAGARWKYQLAAVALPGLVVLAMRLSIAGGMIHVRVADQSPAERWLTTAGSIALLAGPWLATLAAVFRRRKRNGSG
jgi:hypothetical protein